MDLLTRRTVENDPNYIFRRHALRNVASEQTRAANPQLPRAAMAGMRNRLIHEYFRVDLDVVWQVVQHELPVLIPALEALIPPEDEV